MVAEMARVIVAITGASGAVYGVRLLEVLREAGRETHLIVSRWGWETVRLETGLPPDGLRGMATHTHRPDDLGAPVASGSFPVDGMVIAPCSMKTAAAIAHGYSADLIVRAADVCLKERRRLIVVPRETPLSAVHLGNLLRLARLGVVVLPPMPAFYCHPASPADLVDHTVARILDHLGISHRLSPRWEGQGEAEQREEAAARPQHEAGTSGGGWWEREAGAAEGRLREWEARAGEGHLRVQARAWATDDGYVVGLFGGDRTHVGTVVVSVPRPSLADPERSSCTSSVINLPAHKEEEVIRPLADELARVTCSPVVGVAGVHVDGADPSTLDLLARNCREAGRLLLGLITGGSGG
ncbi:MAG: UbiX family flavin prenyltransferase [Bacillota bacterium]